MNITDGLFLDGVVRFLLGYGGIIASLALVVSFLAIYADAKRRR
ncbi:hypothetical protein [Microbacterium sp.]